MYAPDHATWVEVPALANTLCGLSRPIHFRGVCTVVLKLFMLAQPSLAVFGEKDWQQLAIIKKMVSDLNVPVEVVGRPIVREADGLALSSRNVYLTPEERAQAPQIRKSLEMAAGLAAGGERDAARIIEPSVAIWPSISLQVRGLHLHRRSRRPDQGRSYRGHGSVRACHSSWQGEAD